jgi:hypothetical protein
MMTDNTREEFEKAVENDFEKPTFTAMERDGDGYIDGYVDNAWWGWQAATAQAQARIAELEKDAERMHSLCKEFERKWYLQKDRNERLLEALEKLARLGNGDHYGNSIGNCIAIEALGKDKP